MDPDTRRAFEELSAGNAKPFDASAELKQSPLESQALGTDQLAAAIAGTSSTEPQAKTEGEDKSTQQVPPEKILEVGEDAKIKIGDKFFTPKDIEALEAAREQSLQTQAQLEAREKELAERSKLIADTSSFLDLAAKSKFIAPALQALKTGGTDDDAARVALAALNITPQLTPTVESKPDPRSVWPPEGIEPGTVDYEKAYVAHMEFKIEQRQESLRDEWRKEIKQKEDAIAAKALADEEAVKARDAVLGANRELIAKELGSRLPFDTTKLSKEQFGQVLAHLSETGTKEGIPLDEESLRTRHLTAGELRYLALAAYPDKANPFAEAQLPKPELPKEQALQPGDASGGGVKSAPNFLPEGHNPDGWMTLLNLSPVNQ